MIYCKRNYDNLCEYCTLDPISGMKICTCQNNIPINNFYGLNECLQRKKNRN